MAFHRLPNTLFLTYLLLFAHNAFGVPVFENVSFGGIESGKPFTITWSGQNGNQVTIALQKGDSSNLVKVADIISDFTGSSFVWTPPGRLATGDDYALSITDGTNTNYSPQFAITGVGTGISSAHSPLISAQVSEIIVASQTVDVESSSVRSSSIPSSTPTPTSLNESSDLQSSSSITTSSQSSMPSPSFQSSSVSSTSPSINPVPISPSSSPESTIISKSSKGLSTGAKAGIGVASTFGALLLTSVVIFAFWYGKRSASKNKMQDNTFEKAELGPGTPGARQVGKQELADTGIMEVEGWDQMSEEQKKKLEERRQRASELEANAWTRPVEIG